MRLAVGKGVPITQRFKGWRHQGVDFSGRFDTYVYAPENGTVRFQKQIVGGNVLRLFGVTGEHRLAHLSKYLVKDGAKVKEGQKIAVMGDTGWSTARHLHWGLIRNGKYVDPLLYVSKPSTKKYYIVKRGDSLSKIAAKYKTTWQKIQKLNKLSNPNRISVGQRIRVR